MIKKDCSNLSVFIQGPYNNRILNALKIYKCKYPELELVIVAWENDKYKFKKFNVDFVDKIDFIIDPGGQKSFYGEKLNVNRQLESTKKGIRLSSREYCIKMRSDFIIDINKTIKSYNKNKRNSYLDNFKESFLIINLTTVNPKFDPRFFTFCDWLYMGRRDDLEKLISSDLYPEDYLNWQIKNKNTSLRFNAEQWMTIKGLLGDNYINFFNYAYDVNNNIRLIFYNKIIRSFIIVPIQKIGLKSFKYKWYQFGLWNMYTYKEWKSLFYDDYKYFCDFERIIYSFLKNLFKIKSFFK